MLAGVVVEEVVFAWPGIGLYAAQAVTRSPIPLRSPAWRS